MLVVLVLWKIIIHSKISLSTCSYSYLWETTLPGLIVLSGIATFFGFDPGGKPIFSLEQCAWFTHLCLYIDRPTYLCFQIYMHQCICILLHPPVYSNIWTPLYLNILGFSVLFGQLLTSCINSSQIFLSSPPPSRSGRTNHTWEDSINGRKIWDMFPANVSDSRESFSNNFRHQILDFGPIGLA